VAKATAHVWYDLSGNIVAVGRPLSDRGTFTPLGDEETLTLETEVEESLLETLHHTHVVGAERALVSKESSGY
jgi:hypothetical protein